MQNKRGMPNATQQEEDAETSNDDSENLITPIIRNQSQIGNFQEGTSPPHQTSDITETQERKKRPS